MWGVGDKAMNTMHQLIRDFIRSEDGPTATEYAVLIGVICIVTLASMGMFGVHMDDIYVSIKGTLDTEVTGS